MVVLVLGSGGGLRHLVQARLGEIKPSAPLASHSNLVWIKSKLGALAAPLHARSNFPLFRDGDIKCKWCAASINLCNRTAQNRANTHTIE